MPYGHLQGDGFLFLFLPVFPSLAAKVKRPKESRRKTSSPAPVRSLTTEDSSEVCVRHGIWKTPANVKLVHGRGGEFVGWESVNVDGGGPLKLTIISLSTSRVKRSAGKIKLSGEGGENGFGYG